MRLLNDHNGEIDGRVALTASDIRILAISLERTISEAPELAAKHGGGTLLAQLDSMLLAQFNRTTP